MKNLFKYLRKPKSQEYIIVVSGLPRSGTSMMMKMLEAGGLPPLTDNLRTADDDNPKGYYEFERVKKLPDGDISWIEVAQGKAVKVISALLEHLPSTYTYRVPNILKDPAVAALISKYKTLSDPLANRVIGSITADITRSGTESALGDVIADAQLEATSSPATGGAVIAFMNPGGIRADLLYNQISGGEALGQVTYGEAFIVQPFSNNMVVMTMTGGQIKLLLEQQ